MPARAGSAARRSTRPAARRGENSEERRDRSSRLGMIRCLRSIRAIPGISARRPPTSTGLPRVRIPDRGEDDESRRRELEQGVLDGDAFTASAAPAAEATTTTAPARCREHRSPPRTRDTSIEAARRTRPWEADTTATVMKLPTPRPNGRATIARIHASLTEPNPTAAGCPTVVEAVDHSWM